MENPSYSKGKEVFMMDAFISFISEVGFPIVVTMYLLYRIETKLDAVITSLQTLPDRMKD